MRRLAGRKVFTVGKRAYQWEDVLLAAHLWGDQPGLERRVREGIACLKHLDGLGSQAPEDAVDEATEAWRYERDLLSADEMQAWLDDRSLDVDEWLDYLLRSVLRARWADQAAQLVKKYAPSAKEVDAVIYAEAVCSGTLAEFADRVAGRAAIFERASSETKAPRKTARAKAESLKGLPRTAKTKGFLGLTPKETMQRAEHIASISGSFDTFIDEIAAPAALAREIEGHALEWTSLDCETATFDAEEMAKEAVLLVRQDGMELKQAAKMAKASVNERHYILEDLEPRLKDRLIGALPGQLVGPIGVEGGSLLVSVLKRHEASGKDPSLKERARARVIERAIVRETERRVRWHERI